MRRPRTPLRASLAEDSTLLPWVEDGLRAVKAAHTSLIDQNIRKEFLDSIDLDAAFLEHYPNENRWDYLLGHEPSRSVVGVEPHSAKRDEVSTVIAKRSRAREQLRPHLRKGAAVHSWLWVASGRVQFADTEKARRKLDENGITFVGTRVLARHLPPPRQGLSRRG